MGTTSEGEMPAGRYWVGDLLYVLSGDEWADLSLNDGHQTLRDGRRVANFSTVYGDGMYLDEAESSYWVDSGSLGCILADDIRNLDAQTDLGAFVTCAAPFTPRRAYPPGCYAQHGDGGVLELASVRIFLDQCDPDRHS